MAQPIPPLDLEQLDPRLQDRLAPEAERLGYLGDFFRCAAHQPDALLAFCDMSRALSRALPPQLSELVALTVAGLAEDPYVRQEHEREAQSLGLSDAWIAAVLALDSDEGDALEPSERAVQRLTMAALEGHGQGVARELFAVAEALGPERTVAVLLLIGRYATQAIFANALQLTPPVGSIFADVTDRMARSSRT